MNKFKLAVAGFALVLLASLPAQAQAKFERSDMNLYRGYLDLQVEEDSRSEFYAYAITEGCEGCEVLYLLVMDFKGQTRPWTSFRCDVSFKVVKTSSNGLYDIQCRTRVLGGDPEFSTTIYSYDGNNYVAN